jgi:hypothetical protein
MTDKNIAVLTLIVAAVGTIVTVILAYKLNKVSDQVGSVTSNPLGAVKSLFGG